MSISAVLQFVHNDQNSITYTVRILMKMRTFVFCSLKCWMKFIVNDNRYDNVFCNIFQANTKGKTLQWIGKTSQVLPGDEIEEVSGSITHFFVWNINRTISFFCTFRYPKADTNLVIKGRINWFSVNFCRLFFEALFCIKMHTCWKRKRQEGVNELIVPHLSFYWILFVKNCQLI